MQDVFLSHADAALLNRNNVLNYIRNHGMVSRTDIWENMSISRASVTQIIKQLLETGLIEETGELLSGKTRLMRLCADARRMYVFDWNSHTISLMNIGGEILVGKKLSFPTNCAPSAFASIIMAGLNEVRQAKPEGEIPIMGLGLALPGLVDARNATVLYSVELGWRDVSIRRLFAEGFGENVFLERSGNALALGEYTFGAAKGSKHFALVLLGSDGIGASTVIRGDCHHGGNFMYGELGHIKMPVDIICSCGQVGCLEAVVRDLLMRNGGKVTREIIEYLAIGVSTMVNLVDPEMVLLAGDLVERMDEKTTRSLMSSIREKVTNERSRALEISVAQSGDLFGAKGVCAYIFNKCFSVS